MDFLVVIWVQNKAAPKKVAFPICLYPTASDLSSDTKCKLIPQGSIIQSPGGCSWASLAAPALGPGDPASFNEPLHSSHGGCLAFPCPRRRGDCSAFLKVGGSVCLCFFFKVKGECSDFQKLCFCFSSARESYLILCCDTGISASVCE